MEGRYPDYKLFEENCWFTANLGISTLRCLFGGYTEESSTSRPDWISTEELESFTGYCVDVFKQTRFDIQRSPTVLFPVLTAEDIMKCKWDPAFEVPSHPCGPNAKAPLIQLAETTAPSKVAPSTSSSLSISSTGSTPTLAAGAKSSFFAIAALADGKLFHLHGSQSRSTTGSTSTNSSSFSLPLEVPPPPPPYKAHVDWHFNSKTVKRFFSSRRRFLASAVVPFSKAARVITEGDPDKGRA
ncbi:hypothetical protein DL93DRAFT_2077234 [Clavulina sp. PMI_390]|nr:hypothetical protein DL93DRAFT_2077234 [Clavulina sp. PMI_390]